MSKAQAKHRVFVTGMGVVSPLGRDADSNAESLRQARDAIRPVTAFDVSATRCKTMGQVDDSWLEDALPPSRVSKRLHRSAKMVILAVRETLQSSNGAKPQLMVVGTTSGGMSYGEAFFRQLLAKTSRKHFAQLVGNYMPQKPILDGQYFNNIRVPSQVVANACSSGSNAIGHAFDLIGAGLYECILCGGYDAVCELVFVGFDSLQAATPERIRPFDKNRTGLVLGEGAAFFILESEEAAARRRCEAIAEILGYGVSTDTYHITQPHPSGRGPKLAMERALRLAGLHPSEIEYINAHGTGTQFNDATEGLAISNLFQSAAVSSTKSMMGHALGAAGSIEAVFCVLALRDGFLPPNINFAEPDPSWDLKLIANTAQHRKVGITLSNSFGFGGANASLILRRL
ncbi:MAG: beta-ketoacyl-[acyl-carrier-protein] synthase family protein [Verrucomicrobia bacterium]|nr:beta-ketoacyl-[acyl-carrier-protein] synthase family protein [Verrucomicrobiota bacterium]